LKTPHTTPKRDKSEEAIMQAGQGAGKLICVQEALCKDN
jgi:hypothetical protein